MNHFFKESLINASAADLYRWHLEPGAFEVLNPPWEKVRISTPPQVLVEGAEVVLHMRVGPFSLKWVALHCHFEHGRRFDDIQKSGPFKSWQHTHRFDPISENTTRMIDDIHYELYGGAPINQLGQLFVKRRLERMFAYRHDQLHSVFGPQTK